MLVFIGPNGRVEALKNGKALKDSKLLHRSQPAEEDERRQPAEECGTAGAPLIEEPEKEG